MANTALIQGAAMAAPKFNDIAGAFNQSFDQTFTSINADIKAEQDKLDKEREAREKEAQDLYASAPLVKDGQVPEKFRQVFTNSAVQLKKDFASLVQNKASMDPYEFIDKQNEYKTKVNDLNNQVNKLAEWQADYIEIAGESGSELWSQSMTAEEEGVYRKMMSGKYEIVEKDGKMGFNVGADAKIIDSENKSGFFSLDNLPTPKTVASPEHDSFSKMAESIAVTLGPKGIKSDSLLFNRKIEELQDAIKLQSEDKLDSILTDFAGKTGKSGVNAGMLKTMKKEKKVDAVFSFYKNAAEDGIKAYNELYKPPTPTAPSTAILNRQDKIIAEQERQQNISDTYNLFLNDIDGALKGSSFGSKVSIDGNIVKIQTGTKEVETKDGKVLEPTYDTYDKTNPEDFTSLLNQWADNSGVLDKNDVPEFKKLVMKQKQSKLKTIQGNGFNYKPSFDVIASGLK